ncbi:MAG TPA: undecaprenyl-diphosphate phosphatase [Bryobacteraceae bacterium]|nr:undecaprenyl-diphosphate phosphatase [Bryobacteraceae bacterium]
MSIFQAIILAIVQGITEFLPVSSSAHLALAPWLLGWSDQGLTFDIALHFGTLIAVLGYFARDWAQILAQAFGVNYSPDPDLRLNRTLLWLLVAATIPIGVFGLTFQHAAETTLRNPVIIGTMLVAVGLLMLLAERIGRRDRTIGGVTLPDAMAIGFAQALAIVPGTSRSGITITTALFRGLDRHSAGRFSFLLSTPAVAAAAAKAGYDLYKEGGIPPEMQAPFIVGVVASAITGAVVIALFLRYLRSHSLKFFIYYRIAFGIFILVLALFIRP